MVTGTQQEAEVGQFPGRRRHGLVLLATVAVLLLAAATGPLVVVLGFTRLAGTLIAGLGAWLLVGRAGAIDLSVGAAVGAGALGAGILAGEVGVPGVVVLPVAVAVGALVGAASGAVQGRLGRGVGALAALAVGAGLVGLARGVEATGGRSGYHAVPLLVGGDRTDAALVVVLLGVAFVVTGLTARSRLAARAAVAVAAPPVAEAAGRHPARDVGALGAVAGALLGVGGLVGAASSGSVSVDAHGPELTALLVLVALVAHAIGRRWTAVPAPVPAVLAGVLVSGPGILWPLVPLVGTAPPLLVMGPLGLLLILLLARRAPRTGTTGTAGAPNSDAPDRATAEPPSAPPTPHRPMGIRADGLAVPGGTFDVAVAPGEVVALVGPNGAGKSTVLARLGGQLPDGGATVLVDPVGGGEASDAAAPAGVVPRARRGLARAWQRPPVVEVEDLLAAAGGDTDAARWATHVLAAPTAAPTTAPTGAPKAAADVADRARAVLIALTAGRPGVVLLDEPSALLGDPAAVASWIRGLADGGAAVLVVEHRPEIIAVADRVLALERP